MNPWHLPSGTSRGLPFIIPNHWSPEQALAVLELLDDLREVICGHYQLQLQDLLCEQRSMQAPLGFNGIKDDDLPF